MTLATLCLVLMTGALLMLVAVLYGLVLGFGVLFLMWCDWRERRREDGMLDAYGDVPHPAALLAQADRVSP